MRQICEKNSCTGCRACEYVCPRKAIQFCEDRKGFLYPRIDLKKCIDCGLCRQRCTIYRHNKMNRKGDVFAVWSKDIEKRMQSTSGGVFRLISEKILNMGGIVYGAAFNDDMSVHHLRVDNILDLYKLLGSKYVQSNMKYVYGQVKKDLDEGKMVLFSGVACQVAALKNYLNKEYANLLCIDVLCHGVPSPLMLKDYLSYLENRYHSKILKVNFRYKKPGWTVFSMKIDFESGKRYIKSKFKDPFLSFFTRGEDFMLRPSCYECRFTSPERVGDITLADFWLYKADVKEKKGIENKFSFNK